MNVLLTGGAGYIGTHTALEFLRKGFKVIVVDNFSNSSPMALKRVERLANRKIKLYTADLLESAALDKIFKENNIDATVHFAGLKSVGESVSDPLAYYRNNISGTISLLKSMLDNGVKKLVFSSSATVYGEPRRIPIDEDCEIIDAANPYGRTKLMIEKILEDLCRAEADFHAVRLRYFNPAGGDISGEIGEDPHGIPNNLLPFITQFAAGRQPELVVNGDDYATPDGTCIRDYIHVTDLARGHLAALEKLREKPGLATYNLGTGRGYSVLEVIDAFRRVTGELLPYRVGERRPGDVPVSYTDPSLAERDLKWKARRNIEDICRDAWRWQQKNPDGFEA